jgi:hypothetical protein
MKFAMHVLVLVSLMATASVRADETEAVKAWFISLLSEANQNFKTRSMKLEWNRESLTAPSASEIEEIRTRVKNYPEHPDRARLAMLEAALKNGPQEWRETIWFRKGDFRSNTQSGRNDDPFYIDAVRVGSSGWKLNPGELVIVDASGSAPAGHDLGIHYDAVATNVMPFFGVGLEWFGPWEASCTFEAKGSGKWIARAKFSSDALQGTTMITIEWDTTKQRGRCVEAVMQSRGVTNLDQREVASDWFEVPFQTNEMARTITVEQSGKPAMRRSLLRAEVLDENEFDSITKQPDINGRDPIRGQVTFTQVHDFTESSPVFTIKDDTGTRKIQYAQTEEGKKASVLRVLGWVTASMIVVTLVLLRVRAARA